ncbi:MAG: endonuclease [Marinobacter sp.]|nr:endonuclease [Marinobacter sp.]
MFIAALVLIVAGSAAAQPATFPAAKNALRDLVYHDRQEADKGTFYCGCQWEWAGRHGGRVDLESCGYQVRAQENRAIRIEWEHVVPAWVLGHQRQCWQNGGRQNCIETDPVFRVMEADMHNLVPSIGEINADRSNYRFGMLFNTRLQHGACDFRVDFSQRVAEPRDEVKGQVARIYFYMADRYLLRLGASQVKLFMLWDRQFPVTEWERERNRRIEEVMGHGNPFVTGEKEWTPWITLSGAGLEMAESQTQRGHHPVRGNAASRIYHLPHGCPSYSRINSENLVEFVSAADAENAGYRLAGNCR